MFIKLLIFAFCVSQVACGEIADNLRQEYEDMINNTVQSFANLTDFLDDMANQAVSDIDQTMKDLEKQKIDLRDELQVLATDSKYNDSRLMTCFLAGQTRIYRAINDSELGLQNLSQVENNFIRKYKQTSSTLKCTGRICDTNARSNWLLRWCEFRCHRFLLSWT